MDTVEIKLPVSGKTVVIRNYTTQADDERSEQVLYAGVSAEQSSGNQNNDAKIVFPVANIVASQRCYVPRLVKTIDGDSSNIQNRLGELRSQDYKAIEAEVERVVEEHSPKVKAAESA